MMMNKERAKTTRTFRLVNASLVVVSVLLFWRVGAPLLVVSIFGLILLGTLVDHHTLPVFTIILIMLCLFLGSQDDNWWAEFESRQNGRNHEDVILDQQDQGTQTSGFSYRKVA